jgi:hypothetical protein
VNFYGDLVKSHLTENQSGMNANSEPKGAGAYRRMREQQPEYSYRSKPSQDHQGVEEPSERVRQQFETGIPMDSDDLFSRRIQEMNDRKKRGDKDGSGHRGDGLPNQAENRSPEQGFLD